ncbi:hypothetical protein NPIL_365351 [Nephila pilipes]|uniref:Uncharacterized protein n=1 Tax=Nephila pilipes TaxID=299642 RepID=A0A8X6UMK7_NEPPI|nr:hypothetical protein NPIL_365351 [Nephila pilipes]
MEVTEFQSGMCLWALRFREVMKRWRIGKWIRKMGAMIVAAPQWELMGFGLTHSSDYDFSFSRFGQTLIIQKCYVDSMDYGNSDNAIINMFFQVLWFWFYETAGLHFHSSHI